MKIKKLRYRGASTSLFLAITQIVIGSGIAAMLTVAFVVLKVAQNYTGGRAMAVAVTLQAIFLACLLLARGIWNCMLYSRYRKLSRVVMSKSGAITIKQISEGFGKSPSAVFSDIKDTMNRRYWSGYGLTENTFVLVDAKNNSGTVIAGPDMTFTEKSRRSHASLGVFLSVWILCMINPGFHSIWNYIFAGIIATISLFISAAIFQKVTVISQEMIKGEQYKPEPVKTGDEETDGLLKEGLKYFSELVALDRAINDEKLDKPVREILDITRQILDYVKKTPEKSKQIRQFVKYYLPTTIKILKDYDELYRQQVKGENIKEAISKIEGVMDGIVFTFRQQLDDLYRDKNIDISAEVAVMENMINQDDAITNKSGKNDLF